MMRAFIRRLYAAWRSETRSQEEFEFLPSYLELIERPPSPTARVTSITLSSLVLLSLIWAYLGKLDIHATAEGVLIVSSRSQVIQSFDLSNVVSIHVKNGQAVKTGDELIVLDVPGSKPGLEHAKKKYVHDQLEVAIYRALLSDAPINTLVIPPDVDPVIAARVQAQLASMWQEYQSKLAELDTELAVNQSKQISYQTDILSQQKIEKNIQQRLIVHRKLAAAQALGRVKLLEQEREALSAARDIAKLSSELKVLQATTDNLRQKRAYQISKQHQEWHERLNRATTELLRAEQELAKEQQRGRLQVLRAPRDGIVQELNVHTIGGVVQPAQKLMTIAPHDVPQQAEIRVLNKDIGFIIPGQKVTIKVESFPYSRYGTIEATITSVSRDAVKQEERDASGRVPTVFPAQIELAQNYIMLDDKKVLLTPGMAITAEVKIGRRRVIEYIFSPIREYRAEAWREP